MSYSYVYIMYEPEENLVKIGKAAHPSRRYNSLCKFYPQLEFIGDFLFTNDFQALIFERLMHIYYADTLWYHPSGLDGYTEFYKLKPDACFKEVSYFYDLVNDYVDLWAYIILYVAGISEVADRLSFGVLVKDRENIQKLINLIEDVNEFLEMTTNSKIYLAVRYIKYNNDCMRVSAQELAKTVAPNGVYIPSSTWQSAKKYWWNREKESLLSEGYVDLKTATQLGNFKDVKHLRVYLYKQKITPIQISSQYYIHKDNIPSRSSESFNRERNKKLFSNGGVIDVFKRYKNGENVNFIAEYYDVNSGCISEILQRNSYAWVDVPEELLNAPIPEHVVKYKHRLFTDEEALAILIAYANGEYITHLAAQYGVGETTIRNLVRRRTYKYIEVSDELMDKINKHKSKNRYR